MSGQRRMNRDVRRQTLAKWRGFEMCPRSGTRNQEEIGDVVISLLSHTCSRCYLGV